MHESSEYIQMTRDHGKVQNELGTVPARDITANFKMTTTLIKNDGNSKEFIANFMAHGTVSAPTQGAITKKQSPTDFSPRKWHSSGFGFHKKSTVSALSTNQDIHAVRPPQHSRNGTQRGSLLTKKQSIDLGVPKTAGSPPHQPPALQAGTLYDFSQLKALPRSRGPRRATRASVHLRTQPNSFFQSYDVTPHTPAPVHHLHQQSPKSQ